METQGISVVHMEAGQPAGPPPRTVIEAAQTALETGRIGYTESTGIPPLRERIARYYGDRFDIDLDPARVIVTTGSSAGFVLTFLGAFEAGQRVALPTPGYPAYRNILGSVNIDVIDVETNPENRWMPVADDLDRLRSSGSLNGLLVASPNNPTGTMLHRDELKSLVSACDALGIWFVSDEIYHGITFDVDETTALSFSDDAIIINSFSKYYCMTGWRIGWMVVPERLVRPMECLAQNLYISPPALSQAAAIAAFDATEELEARKAVYAGNRDYLAKALPAIGLGDFTTVEGAFYVYVDVGRYTNDSLAFSKRILRETGVAVTAGADFDPQRGHRYLRLSFAGARDEMEEAIRRLGAWIPR